MSRNIFTIPSAIVLLALSFAQAHALGLGAIEEQSALGQPLYVVILVIGAQPDASNCVKVSAGSNDLPAPAEARVSLIEKGQISRLEVRTRQAINEPVLGMTVSVGCDAPVKRSYVLLLDPPIVAELAWNSSTLAGSNSPAAVPALLATDAQSLGHRNAGSGSAGLFRPHRSQALAHHGQSASKKTKRNRLFKLLKNANPAAIVVSANASSEDAARPAPLAKSNKLTPSKNANGADRLVLSKPAPDTSSQLRVNPLTPAPSADADTQRTLEASTQTALPNDQDPQAALLQHERELTETVTRLTLQAQQLQQQIDRLSARNQSLERAASVSATVSASRSLASYRKWVLTGLALLVLVLGTVFGLRYRRLKRSGSDTPWWSNAPAEVENPSEFDLQTGGIEVEAVTHAMPDSEIARVNQGPTPIVPQVRELPKQNKTDGLGHVSKSAVQNSDSAQPSGGPVLSQQARASPLATDIGLLPSAVSAIELGDLKAFTLSKPLAESSKDTKVAAQKLVQSQTPKRLGPAQSPASIKTKPQTSTPAAASAGPKQVDFILDLANAAEAAQQKDVHEAVDFSIATVIEAAGNNSLNPVTESFFTGTDVSGAKTAEFASPNETGTKPSATSSANKPSATRSKPGSGE